ncbi:hypothetical protein [Plantactinospora sp. CA-290183]|uniref:hypothetical protein n=1 Tax=Plantactinospora sp. CA-290183 TaxID=3240006 RepID=UPI003D8BFB05
MDWPRERGVALLDLRDQILVCGLDRIGVLVHEDAPDRLPYVDGAEQRHVTAHLARQPVGWNVLDQSHRLTQSLGARGDIGAERPDQNLDCLSIILVFAEDHHYPL